MIIALSLEWLVVANVLLGLLFSRFHYYFLVQLLDALWLLWELVLLLLLHLFHGVPLLLLNFICSLSLKPWTHLFFPSWPEGLLLLWRKQRVVTLNQVNSRGCERQIGRRLRLCKRFKKRIFQVQGKKERPLEHHQEKCITQNTGRKEGYTQTSLNLLMLLRWNENVDGEAEMMEMTLFPPLYPHTLSNIVCRFVDRKQLKKLVKIHK